MPEQIKQETENTLLDRRARMEQISAYANDITRDELRSLDDMLLTTKLWRMDEFQVQLDVLGQEITDELTRYETESLIRRQQKTAMQAAALNAQLTPRPLRSKLGE